MKRNTVNIFSKILLVAYLGLLVLPVFHIHPIFFDTDPRLLTEQNSTNYFDPFQNANSECSVTQFARISYINDIVLAKNNDLSSYHFDYIPVAESNKPLQVIFDSNGLRAPPTHS